jgi:flavin reductase (DIM6/NTAB) family NADH-FMN oxidoreductase RutF
VPHRADEGRCPWEWWVRSRTLSRWPLIERKKTVPSTNPPSPNGLGSRVKSDTIRPDAPATVSVAGTAGAAKPTPALVDAMALIPAGAFVLTSSYTETRGGVIVRWVQTVSSTPPLVVVAIEKGQPLSPIIRDSRRFGLCQLAPDDRVLRRLFEPQSQDSNRGSQSRSDSLDPFLGLPTKTLASGVPILLKSVAWLECELTRHLDVEGNCELYIGLVHAGDVLRPSISEDDLQHPGATSAHGMQSGGRSGATEPPASAAPSSHPSPSRFGRLDRHPNRTNNVRADANKPLMKGGNKPGGTKRPPRA